MMRRKSAAQQIAEGDPAKKGVHRLNAMLQAEPQVENGLPSTSPRLKGDAQLIYQFFVHQLEQSELAKAPDVFALERAALALALCWKADQALEREGPIRKIPIMAGISNRRKRVGWREVKSKWLGVRESAVKEFRLFAGPFGLTGPASRLALMVETGSSLESNRRLWDLLMQPRPANKTETPEN